MWLIAFCAAGAAVRLGAAIAFTRIERPDEIFQNLEPAYRLWTGHGIITWEWRDGIRSWLLPGALSLLMSLTGMLHLPDSTALPLIWAVLSVVSCGVVAAGVCLGWHQFGTTGALLCGILTAFWPDLVYFGPKTLGEVQAGNLLVVAAALASVGPARRGAIGIYRRAARRSFCPSLSPAAGADLPGPLARGLRRKPGWLQLRHREPFDAARDARLHGGPLLGGVLLVSSAGSVPT